MPDPLTYGQLATTAARLTATAATQPVTVSLPADRANADAAGITLLVTVAARHARFLARPFDDDSPPGRLARELSLATTAAQQTLPDPPPVPADRWQQAADTLAVAHDLLTAQLGPAAEHRGPDAWLLASPTAVAAATARLADITLTAAISARELAAHTPANPRPSRAAPRDTTTDLSPAARTLRHLAELAVPASQIHERSSPHGTESALDDVRPLLGDYGAHPLDRQLDHLRLLAHHLSQPDATPNHHTLIAFADLAVLIAGRAQTLATQRATFGRTVEKMRYHDAADQAQQTITAWQEISRSLRDLQSLGTHGQTGRHLTADIARLIDHTTSTAAHGDVRQLPTAFTAIRRAILILPDLASTGIATTSQMIKTGTLTQRTPAGSYRPVPEAHARALRRTYKTAQQASRDVVATFRTLTGPQPLPHQAAYLAQHTAPVPALAPAPTRSPETRPAPTRPTTPPLRTNPTAQPSTATRVEARTDALRIHDPHHGTLDIRNDLLTAALVQREETLKAILRRQSNIHLQGDEPPITLAALVATHAPHELHTAHQPTVPLLFPDTDARPVSPPTPATNTAEAPAAAPQRSPTIDLDL
ncbi:hypothetical protein [Frankia sp. Cas4]|uniref:hypothetical protein n=1 Tax=Frankia sp. Cas4 TaxID=3073927 RepID=UPI002AD2CBC7|nr:hypothetical protein [Frankia sp. Cas4]